MYYVSLMILYFQIYLYLRAVNNTILSLGDSGVNIHKKYHGNMDMVRIYKKIHYDVGTFLWQKNTTSCETPYL